MESDIEWLADQKPADQKPKLMAENAEPKNVRGSGKQTRKNLNMVNVAAPQQLTDLGIGRADDYAKLKEIKDTFCKGQVSVAEVFNDQRRMIDQLARDLDKAKRK
jgi:hypothetical protein